MSLGFRQLEDLAQDIVLRVQALSAGGQPLFAAVEAWWSTQPDKLVERLARQTKLPACFVVLGEAEYNDDTSSMRTRTVALWIVGEADTQRAGARPIHELAEALIEGWQPPAATPGTPVRINGVQYAVTGDKPIFAPRVGRDIYAVELEATDHRQRT